MFKVGDKVKCIKTSDIYSIEKGNEYFVKQIFKNDSGAKFLAITDESGNQIGDNYFAWRFTRVEGNMDIINGK